MSIADDIRAAMRAGSGPMTMSDIRMACQEDYTAEQISGAVMSMYKTGEVLRDGDGRGKFTYMLDPSYRPKRAKNEDAAIPERIEASPTVEHALTKHAAADRAAKQAAKNFDDLAKSVHAQLVDECEHVSLPRSHLKTILAALIARHPDPMDAALRAAVVGAFHCTL